MTHEEAGWQGGVTIPAALQPRSKTTLSYRQYGEKGTIGLKKVINGAVYNTATALLRGKYETQVHESDLHWYVETLYQKKTGEFFLYGQGNAASPYCKTTNGGEWNSGEKIIPLTYEGAKKWAEKHLSTDECAAIFSGDPGLDDGDRSRLNCRISASAHEKLKRIQQEKGGTIGGIIESLLGDRPLGG